MRRQLAVALQLAEHGVEAEVDALDDDEGRRHVGRLHDLAVRRRRVEEPAHRLRLTYSGVIVDRPSLEDELVEVAEVVLDLLVGERRAGAAGGRRRSMTRRNAGDVAVEDDRLDHVGRTPSTSSGVKRLTRPKSRNVDPAAGAEQVVAGVRVAVEGVQPVEAAEHEPVDRLAGEVALLLAPRRAPRRSGRRRPARS